MESNRSLDSAWWALRVGLGLAAFLAGLDKFFNILTDWSQYVSPFTAQLLPISVGAFLGIVGVVEMLVGLAVLTAWTRLGAYVAMAAHHQCQPHVDGQIPRHCRARCRDGHCRLHACHPE